MSDMQMPSRQPLGVGAIIGESFSIMFGHFGAVLAVSFLPVLIGLIPSMLLGVWIAPRITQTGVDAGFWVGIALSTVIQLVLTAIMLALVVRLAYDAKLDRRPQPARYIAPAIRAAIPLTLINLVVFLLFGLGWILFFVPGLWVAAVFCVTAPVLVIEGAGFSAMSRSVALTKGYRWPIVGTLILVFLCMLLMAVAVGFVAGVVAGANMVATIISVLINLIGSSLQFGFAGIAVALIYARLREIKEGIGLDEIVSVFD